MYYINTRESAARGEGQRVTSAAAIVNGIAQNGGLYLPETLPAFSLSDINSMAGKSYAEIALRVISPFLSDFTEAELKGHIDAAYNSGKFPAGQKAPVETLGDSTHVLELFHGPSCAFKDFALQLLPFLMTAAIKKTGLNKTVAILVATSGDTGKASLEGFAGVPGTKICVFYPSGGTSRVQELQMTTQTGSNVKVVAVKGNFDDTQTGVKKIFADRALAERLASEKLSLSSANSINWGRLVPQIAYYFSAYCQLLEAKKIKLGNKINVAVPTGNFGNILAAHYAKACGLPIGKFICASNENNVLFDFIATGVYNKDRPFHLTSSPSMDILISSNLERLLFILSGNDSAEISRYMQALAEHGRYEVNETIRRKISEAFYGGWASDTEVSKTIGSVWKKYHYLSDTHTAVAFKVYEDYITETGDHTPTVITATASPFKFSDHVLTALSAAAYSGADGFGDIEALAMLTGLTPPASLTELQGKTELHRECVNPDGMKDAVAEWLLNG